MSCSNSRIGKNYQIRVGPPNPKTKIPPVIPAPAWNWEHWRGDKKYLLPSIINSQNLEHIEGNDEYVRQTAPPFPNYEIQQQFIRLQDELAQEKNRADSVKNPNDPNRYLFTNNLQPGISTRDEVLNPINANLGISYTPQFQPIGVETQGDNVTFVRYDDDTPNNFENSANRQAAKQASFRGMQNVARNSYVGSRHVPVNMDQRHQSFTTEGTRSQTCGAEDFVGRQAQNELYERNEIMMPRQMNLVNRQASQVIEPFTLENLDDEDVVRNRPARAPCTKNTDTGRFIYDRNVQPFNYNTSVQPGHASQIIEPVNDSVGVNYDPNFEPVNIEVGPVGSDEYSVARWDPQLIRDNVEPNRMMENPKRTRWSAKMSPFEAASMTVTEDQIYDPRYNGYGDDTRSYLFENQGQIRYYYSDIDSFRRPNYIIRSDVDHMLFQDPMGAVKPEYYRNELQQNVRDLTNQKYIQDDLFHREDMMERLSRKMDQRSWQYRFAPLNKQARTVR